jgi:UbiD family decarboxylase
MPGHLQDLREYISALEAIGELQRVEAEVDLDLEIGAIGRRLYETGGPAALLQSIRGIERGFRVLAAPAGVSRQPGLYLARVALSLGLEPTANGRDIINTLLAAMSADPIPPRLAADGPCKQNVLTGDAVDLERFPAPLLHDGDGGRYIGTYGTVVARTPDGRWTNWGMPRVMLLDSKRMTGIVHPVNHLGMIHNMWKEEGRDMPFALCLGTPQAIAFVGGMSLPPWVDESGYVGAYFGQPVDVVRCETVDLEVPASSEIVIEGYLSVTETAPEGPMGEFGGYLQGSQPVQRPVYNVTAVTYRDDPILPVVVAGEPVEEDHTTQAIPSSATVLADLRTAGVPATLAWCTLESANHWLAVTVSDDWQERIGGSKRELIERVGRAVFERNKFGSNITKVILVGDDIDPTDLRQLVWAYATRCHPVTGQTFFHDESDAAAPLLIFLNTGEKFASRTSKVIYDCLPPDGQELPRRSSFAHIYPAAIQERVLARWGEYGFAAATNGAPVAAAAAGEPLATELVEQGRI